LQHEQHLVFVHSKTGDVLDLHWRDVNATEDEILARWARSHTSVWQGCAFQVMDPNDLVLYLCGHGVRHEWFRAKWLGDLARIHAAGRVDWATCLEAARGLGQQRVLLSSLLLLQQVYSLPVPELTEARRRSLPPLLILGPRRALKAPELLGLLATLMRSFRYYRCDRLILPRQNWREFSGKMLYSRVDYHVLHLPDRLFWAYVPLRPFLWLWRRMMRRKLT
jgi:hypothetical protein